ncbi:hypothetical protein TWF696_006475 [Orbilia brochopaga]|uniref:Uncharacterized protein n=1 Tax=Orbilia brochopaga TaxID=3140254 RepID=A0AAV9UYT5_9PEZI
MYIEAMSQVVPSAPVLDCDVVNTNPAQPAEAPSQATEEPPQQNAEDDLNLDDLKAMDPVCIEALGKFLDDFSKDLSSTSEADVSKPAGADQPMSAAPEIQDLSHIQSMNLDALEKIACEAWRLNEDIECPAGNTHRRTNQRLLSQDSSAACLTDGQPAGNPQPESHAQPPTASAQKPANTAVSNATVRFNNAIALPDLRPREKPKGFIRAFERELIDLTPIRKQMDKKAIVMAVGILQIATINKFWLLKCYGGVEGCLERLAAATIDDRIKFIAALTAEEFARLCDNALTPKDQLLLSNITTARLAGTAESLVSDPGFLAHHLLNPELVGIRKKWERMFRWAAGSTLEQMAGQFRMKLRRAKKGITAGADGRRRVVVRLVNST